MGELIRPDRNRIAGAGRKIAGSYGPRGFSVKLIAPQLVPRHVFPFPALPHLEQSGERTTSARDRAHQTQHAAQHLRRANFLKGRR
jgi:hypothetical protein